uniref:Uncharacterized protein n=1 Tax=Arundo donax TaxID=35708 RepID=A0A0A9DX13_ARUDO
MQSRLPRLVDRTVGKPRACHAKRSKSVPHPSVLDGQTRMTIMSGLMIKPMSWIGRSFVNSSVVQ